MILYLFLHLKRSLQTNYYKKYLIGTNEYHNQISKKDINNKVSENKKIRKH